MARTIRLDCKGRSARELVDRLTAELDRPGNGRRVVLFVDDLPRVQDSVGRLLRQILDVFNRRETNAALVDPSGCADVLVRALGGSVHVQVCRSEAEVSGPLDVLVVEDTPDSLEFVRELLESAGHRVACAATGAEAVRLGRARRFDLILLDLVLPDVDGVEVARRLAETKTPVVAMSAHLDRWSEEEAHRAGFRRFLPKPFKTAELLAAIAPR
jgi:CheY-like chemotaxis protein